MTSSLQKRPVSGECQSQLEKTPGKVEGEDLVMKKRQSVAEMARLIKSSQYKRGDLRSNPQNLYDAVVCAFSPSTPMIRRGAETRESSGACGPGSLCLVESQVILFQTRWQVRTKIQGCPLTFRHQFLRVPLLEPQNLTVL